MNLFDILGPVMVGPSSSHTAGAVKIGAMVRSLLGELPKTAEIGLHGSFAETGKGHGTEEALVAGLLGMEPDDVRIPESFQLAQEAGLDICIQRIELPDAHPNTALLKVRGKEGPWLEVQASSLGGSRIMIDTIDGMKVNCSGEVPTLIIRNIDRPGLVANVTAALADHKINIARMHLYRGSRGGSAVMVVETDQRIPREEVERLAKEEDILKITYIAQEEGK